ncbi:MAG: sulfatase-like hydrolase/transferase [Planctomycetaceae bacterium]|nr:sulfatase-like hydrolase/transferase [Planctomycetaceae bacterium]
MSKAILTLLACFALTCGSAAVDKPIVLLIMVDDLRDYGGAFTKDVVKTPNLDRLRARGTTFQRAYVQYPVCNPSRSSLMTGLRAEQTGIVGNDVPLRQKLPDVITLPQLCKEAGWQSHAFGKLFHLGGGRDTEARQRWMDIGRSWHTTQSLVEFIDLYPTVADYCDLKRPHVTPGVSLRPVLADPAARVKDAAFTLVTRGDKLHGQSLRTTRWRFTRWSDGNTELYDHDADPEELRNVSSSHADVIATLTARLQQLPPLAAKPGKQKVN